MSQIIYMKGEGIYMYIYTMPSFFKINCATFVTDLGICDGTGLWQRSMCSAYKSNTKIFIRLAG